jgi:hypothetical protein
MGDQSPQEDDHLPEESCIINDDIAHMGQEPDKIENVSPGLLLENDNEFTNENNGFLDSSPNMNMLASEVSKKNSIAEFKLEQSVDNINKNEEEKPETNNQNFGGFLSDDDPKINDNPLGNDLLDESKEDNKPGVDFGNMKNYMKTETKKRFDNTNDIKYGTNQKNTSSNANPFEK